MLETRSIATFVVDAVETRLGLDATLTALKAQDLAEFKIHLLLPSGPEAPALQTDKRFAVIHVGPDQSWAERVNAALKGVASEYACLLSSGDTPATDYLSTLVGALRARPEAVCAFPCASGAASLIRTEARPYLRLLDLMTSAGDAPLQGAVFKASLIAKIGPLAVPGASMALHAAILRLGPGIAVTGTECRFASAPRSAPVAPEVWATETAQLVTQALQVPGSAQEMRQIWMAGITRLTSPVLSAPHLQRAALSNAEQSDLVEAFLTSLDADPAVDVPYVLDQDWERLRHWTKACLWEAPTALDLTGFGPQPVNAGEAFNPGPSGAPQIWVETRERIPPGAQIRLGGKVLDTEIDGNRATASVPPAMTAQAGELDLALLAVDGAELTKPDTFWVLRRSALGRGVVSLLRRMRGQPAPGSRLALPAPKQP